MPNIIDILGDPTAALAAIDELGELMAGKSAAQLGLDIPDDLSELIRPREISCAAGAREVWVRLEPSERFLGLLATLRARQGNFNVVEHGEASAS